jgi:hypothetical protein
MTDEIRSMKGNSSIATISQKKGDEKVQSKVMLRKAPSRLTAVKKTSNRKSQAKSTGITSLDLDD